MERRMKVRVCECMCYICGKGDKYYKGCHCGHECCKSKETRK